VQWFHEHAPMDGDLHRANTLYLYAASQSSTLAAFAAAAGLELQGGELYILIPTGPVNPRTTIVMNIPQREILIVMEGMIGFDKVQACLTGWGNPNFSTGPFIYPYGEAAANIYAAILGYTPTQPWLRVTIIGFSYGGAVAHHLATMMTSITAVTDLKIYSYGAPKPCISRYTTSRINQATRRVFLTNDPVPLLPPSYENFGPLWILTGVPLAREWSKWIQVVIGFTNSGVVEFGYASEPTFRFGPSALVTLAGWAAGTNAFGNFNHSIAIYQAAMNLMLTVFPTTSAPQTLETPRVRRTAREADIEAARDLAIQEMAGLAEQNPQETALGIVQAVTPVPGERYYGRKINGEQAVLYGSQIVQYVRTRRLRRALVRKLNAMSQ
jgi:Lipase (class 3)